MTGNAADRLLDAVDRLATPACVGLDPVFEKLPRALRSGAPREDPSASDACGAVGSIRAFSLGVLDAVAEVVPCVKIQSACFERYGHLGVHTLSDVIVAASERGLEVILDAKRGDIGISAEHYAAAAFGSAPGGADERRADWITVSAYLGEDGVRPFLRPGRGAFALVRTSNPGGDVLQTQRLADGRTVAEAVAELAAQLGALLVGARGYSALGAVVAANRPADAAKLRALMPQQPFLVPGFGAQGGGVEDIGPLLDATGHGAIITASRSVIYAGDPEARDWRTRVRDAAERLAEDLGRAAGLR